MKTALLALLLLTSDAVAGDAYRRGDWPWITSGCQSTRTRVLIRDAQSVELDAAKCKVVAGAWHDRYTGATVEDARALDIDHLVPLAFVYAHGGAAWSAERRKEYANFLGYRRALVAVGASANRAKGAKGPAEWRPPNRDAWCSYAEAWSSQLVIWELTIDPATRGALREMLATC